MGKDVLNNVHSFVSEFLIKNVEFVLVTIAGVPQFL